MRTAILYLWFSYKKSIKVLAKTMVSLVVMTAGLAIGIFFLSRIMMHAQVFQAIEVGLVIPKEEKQTQMVTQFLEQMESVRTVCHFQYMEEDKAREALEAGEIQTALLFPEHFYQDVDTGKNTPITMLYPADASFETQVFRELLLDGVSLLRTAEAGVYASLETARIYSAQIPQSELGNVIARAYVEEAFSRGDLFVKRIDTPFGELGLYEYYLAAGMIILFLMSGLSMSFLYDKKSVPLEERLRIYGVGPFVQSCVKVLLMANLLWIIGVVVYTIACVLSKVCNLSLLWFDAGVLLAYVPLCLAIASYFHLLLSLGGSHYKTALLLMGNVFLFFTSGAILPAAFLPTWAQKIGSVLPFCGWSDYESQLFFGWINRKMCLQQILFACIVTGIGALIQCVQSRRISN